MGADLNHSNLIVVHELVESVRTREPRIRRADSRIEDKPLDGIEIVSQILSDQVNKERILDAAIFEFRRIRSKVVAKEIIKTDLDHEARSNPPLTEISERT